MKFAVRSTSRLGRKRMPPHRCEGLTHGFDIVSISTLRSQPGCGRFDYGAQFEQVANETEIGLSSKSPCQDVGIEEIPPPTWQNLRARLRTALNQAFSSKDLHSFSVSTARDVERFRKRDFAR